MSNLDNGEAAQGTQEGSSEVSAGVDSSAELVAPSAQKAPVEEKLLNQSRVNEIVGHAKKEAYEKARREVLAEQQQAQAPYQASTVPAESSMGGVPSLDENRIRQLINEESQRKSDYAMAEKTAGEFVQKLTSAKEKYPDMDDVASQLNLASVPQLVQWTNGLDNTADVIYNIGKNPSKFANLLTLTTTAPHLAVAELQRLSKSIKDNEAGAQANSPPPPLGQIKPSATGADNGSMGVRDYKKANYLKV